MCILNHYEKQQKKNIMFSSPQIVISNYRWLSQHQKHYQHTWRASSLNTGSFHLASQDTSSWVIDAVCMLFTSICFYREVKWLATTAYHPQTNFQAQRNSHTIIKRIWHHVAQHQCYETVLFCCLHTITTPKSTVAQTVLLYNLVRSHHLPGPFLLCTITDAPIARDTATLP